MKVSMNLRITKDEVGRFNGYLSSNGHYIWSFWEGECLLTSSIGTKLRNWHLRAQNELPRDSTSLSIRWSVLEVEMDIQLRYIVIPWLIVIAMWSTVIWIME